MTRRAKTFDDLEREALTAHAMSRYVDPKSPDEIRQAAHARLLAGGDTFDTSKLTDAELAEAIRILNKAHGRDERGALLPMDATSVRARAAEAYRSATEDLRRAEFELRQVWPDYFAPKPAIVEPVVVSTVAEPVTPEPEPVIPEPEPADLIEIDDAPSVPRRSISIANAPERIANLMRRASSRGGQRLSPTERDELRAWRASRT